MNELSLLNSFCAEENAEKMISDILESGLTEYTEQKLREMYIWDVYQVYSQVFRKKTGLITHILYASADEDILIFVQFEDENEAEIVHRFLKTVSDTLKVDNIFGWATGEWRLISPSDKHYDAAISGSPGICYHIPAKK